MGGPALSLAIYCALVVGVLLVMIGVSYFLGQRHNERSTATPFESGIQTTGSARIRFPAYFYVVAMLFVAFDLESVFLYAYALVARTLGPEGFWQMLVFVGVLLIALIYVVRVGVLNFGPRFRRGEP